MLVIPPLLVNDAKLTATNVAEPSGGEPAAWSSITNYGLGALVMVTTPDVHTIYKSLQTGNLNNDPVADAGTFRSPVSGGGTWWIVQTATNRYKMFDAVNGTQTTNADTVAVTVTPAEVVNGLAALNISAATMQVVVDDPVEGVVYDKTINLISDSGINNWYDYFFTPIERQTDVVLIDLPAYKDADIDVTFTETGATVKVGVLAMGYRRTIGTTLHGTTGGIIDYSRKETDEFGNFTILQRPFSKRRDYDIIMETGKTGAVENFLASIRTTPVIWVGNSDYGVSVAYGFFRDFSIILADAVTSNCSIQVEGLT